MKQSPKLISVLMTVRCEELLRQRAIKGGIQGYLEKPFNLKLEKSLSI